MWCKDLLYVRFCFDHCALSAKDVANLLAEQEYDPMGEDDEEGSDEEEEEKKEKVLREMENEKEKEKEKRVGESDNNSDSNTEESQKEEREAKQQWCIPDSSDLLKEYARMNCPDSSFSLSGLNLGFERISTYPELLVLPAAVSKEVALGCMSFRSKGRLPVVVWRGGEREGDTEDVKGIEKNTDSKKPSSVLVRCSQPLLGLKLARNPDDEAFLRILSKRGPVHVLDCRPKVNSLANLATGGGWEVEAAYPHVQVHFLNIENIHAVRKAFAGLHGLFIGLGPNNARSQLTNNSSTTSISGGSGGGGSGGGGNVSVGKGDGKGVRGKKNGKPGREIEKRYREIERKLQTATATRGVQWFIHISTILEGAKEAQRLLLSPSTTVVVHCSDGWDRTPQITSLAQLLVDPFYRTLEGLCTLVRKEFVSFGHKFGQRSGPSLHRNGREMSGSGGGNGSSGGGVVADLVSGGADSQRSPIFLQWIDCIFQIIIQNPTACEFNTRFLLDLSLAVYSGQFVSFMLNSEKERAKAGIASVGGRASFWDHVGRERERYVSKVFDRSLTHPLEISTSPTSFSLFVDLYRKWDPWSGHPIEAALV